MDGRQGRFESRLCWLLLCVGFLYSLAAGVLAPPFLLQADEGRRWVRAYALSEGAFFTQRTGPSSALAALNVEAATFERELLSPYERGGSVTWEQVTEASRRLSAKPYKEQKINVASEAVVPSILYLPGAAGIATGRALGLEFLSQLHLGRLVSCASVFALLLLVGRMAGRHRLPVVAGLLPPACLGIYSALDHTSFAILAPVAAVLGFLHLSRSEKPATWRSYASLVLLFLLLCLAKQPYSAFALCALVIPASRFGGLGRKLLLLLLCGLPALGYQLWWLGVTDLDMMEYFGSGKAQPGAQLSAFLSDPLHFLVLVWRTLATAEAGNIAGSLLPYTPIWGLLWFGLVPLALVLAASALREHPWTEERRSALAPLVLASALLTLLLFFLGFFLSYTAPDAARIEGVAFRYFLPLLPLFALALAESLPQRFNAPRLSALLFAGFALSSWIVIGAALWSQTEWLRL